MAISDAGVVRHVRCPKCFSVLQEPRGAPVYQCGGCGTNLRAKNRTGSSQEVISAPSSLGSGLPPQGKHLGSSDVASTSGSTPEAPITGRQHGVKMTSRHETDDLVSARNNAPEKVLPVEEEEHVQSASQQSVGNSEDFTRGDDAGSAQCSASASDGKAQLLEGRNGQTEPDAAAKKSSEETSQPRHRDVVELSVPSAAQTAADSQPAPAVSKRDDDAAAAAAERKTTSPPRDHARRSSESLAPLQKRILKTVDDLKDDLSELFRKSPELNKPRTHARPPRLPRQGGYAPRDAAMAATSLAAIRARHAAVHRPGYIARAGKPGQLAAPRGLPSRRYRRCRADHPCGHDGHHGPSCHHGCCPHHGKRACTSCRGHCCRPGSQEPPAPRKPPAAKDVKRRAPPRNHCRPVLKGAPFIVCSSCFKLVQVPADFAVSTKKVRRLRCGSCSTVLCYSYRDPNRKKHGDQYSTDGSQSAPSHARRDPFAFMDDFGHIDVSYSTEDEQPLHVSRNSSFNTVDEVPNATAAQQQQSSSLHRLMGYGSASDLLFRQHSPDLYESFSERTTPEAASLYDRKGKGVCVDFDDDGDDDSDEDCSGALKRSRVRGSGWPLPGILNKGMPGVGAIRIKS